VSNSIPLPHVDDRATSEQRHGRIVDQINDMLIPFQDASYALGRARGQQENAEAWQALESLVGALDLTNWSSWQTTADFSEQWKAAKALLDARKAK
jgi:hypothetical protein